MKCKSYSLADRLSWARGKRRLTQVELSQHAGLDRKTCFNIESERSDSNQTLDTLERLARALDVPPDWLASGGDELQGEIAALEQDYLATRRLEGEIFDRACLEFPPDAVRAAGRAALAGKVAEPLRRWSPDVDGPARSLDPAAERLFSSLFGWPYSHRSYSTYYHDLPQISVEYVPILKALALTLSEAQRLDVLRWLVQLLDVEPTPSDRAQQLGDLQALRALLRSAVDPSGQPAVERLMAELEGQDLERRGGLALQLIVDGGLPLSAFPEIQQAAARLASRRFPRLRAYLAAAIQTLGNTCAVMSVQEQAVQLPPRAPEQALVPR